MTREEALALIDAERDVQWNSGYDYHYDEGHKPLEWFAILSGRLGKLGEHVMLHEDGGVSYMHRLVELAAVAVAWLEQIED